MKHRIRKVFLFAALLTLTNSCRQTAENTLRSAVRDYNTQCPVRLSELTRIDSLNYDKSANDVSFHCTFVGITSCSPNDTILLEAMRIHATDESGMSLNAMQSNNNGQETLMLLKRLGASLTFVYHTADGTEIFRKSHSKADWQKAM